MFTPDTLAFLAENHGRNDRDWFLAHKDDYENCVRQPLLALSDALAPTVETIDRQLITDPKLAVSRIYCDIRYSRGMLYRDIMWISFRRDRKAFPCWPEFYFVLSPKEFFYGCGYYSARADAMSAIRQLILADSPPFTAAKAALDANNYIVMEGDCYKRTKFPNAPEELRDWLDRKSFCFTHRPQGFRLLFGNDLAETVAADYRAMAPLYRLLLAGELEAARIG